MEKKKLTFKGVIGVSGTYLAFAIGSGFATGQEVMQYFTAFGIGAFGALILFFIFGSLIDTEFITLGQREEYQKIDRKDAAYRYYCGKYVGIFYDYFTNLFVYMSFIVMCSGAGATLNQHYGLPDWVGVLLLAAASGLTVTFGLIKVADIIGKIGPALIILMIAICIPNIFMGDLSISEGIRITPDLDIIKATDSWPMSIFNYLGFSILWMVAFLPAYGRTLDSMKQAAVGQIVGIAALSFTALIMILAMFANITSIADSQIPILVLATNLSPVLGTVYAIIIMLGIYSSATPLLYSPATRFVSENSTTGKLLILGLALLGATIALLLPYDRLLNIIYSVNGYVGIIFIILVFIKAILRFVSKHSRKA